MIRQKHKGVGRNIFSFKFINKIFSFLLIHLCRSIFVPPGLRPYILKTLGIKFNKANTVFIGHDVLFDSMKGTSITIGQNVVITTGTKIINHYPVFSKEGVQEYNIGDVIIKDYVFIGMNTLIVKPVTIGKGSVLAAGSVITKDVAPYTVVAGNPAKVVSQLNF